MTLMMGCSGQNGRYAEAKEEEDISMQNIDAHPVIEFNMESHDFGTIIEGEQVVCYFDYRNSGNAKLMITSVETSCGCTTPGWSKAPLEPGGEDRLKVVFNSSGRVGAQRKVVTVHSNAANEKVRLIITANIHKK